MKSNVIFFTGAGLSAESGLATFRGSEDGLWNGFDIDVVCNYQTWKKNYEKVHKFYSWRRKELSDVEPNEAHKAISRMQEKYSGNVHIITQKVDDLLERAGCKDVIHVHGFLPELRCPSCNHTWNVGYTSIDHQNVRCPNCDRKPVKPNVVFFGERAPMYSNMYATMGMVTHDSDALVVVVGTDGCVVSIDDLLMGYRGKSALCNLHRSPYIDHEMFDYVFEEKATKSMLKVEKLIDKMME